jgi:hypothetical protein
MNREGTRNFFLVIRTFAERTQKIELTNPGIYTIIDYEHPIAEETGGLIKAG